MPSEAKALPLRRSSRIQIRIPVLISGTLADGKRFVKEAHVLTVSKFGARIKADIRLEVGAEVRVETKQQAGALFRVVWLGHEGTPREGEIGVEYVKMSNLLGISFPH
jgi:PilZ domain-containing protein